MYHRLLLEIPVGLCNVTLQKHSQQAPMSDTVSPLPGAYFAELKATYVLNEAGPDQVFSVL